MLITKLPKAGYFEVFFDISKQKLVTVEQKLILLQLPYASLNVFNEFDLNEVEVSELTKPNQYELTWGTPSDADFQRVVTLPLQGTYGLSWIINEMGTLVLAKVVARNTMTNVLEHAGTNLYIEFGSKSIDDWPDHEDYKMV